MQRTLALVKMFWLELLRSPASIFGGLLVFFAIPFTAWFVAESDDNALWMSRFMFVEGTRMLVPLLTIAGAAFILRPRMRRGWSTLLARRSEWLMACVLTTFTIVVAVNGLLLGGSLLAQATIDSDSTLHMTENPKQVDSVRKDGSRRIGKADSYSWMNSNYSESLVFDLKSKDDLQVTVQYESALSNVSAPGIEIPFKAVGITESGERVSLQIVNSGSRKALLKGQGKFKQIQLIANDPGLIVGVTAGGIHIREGEQSAFWSMFALFIVAISGTLLLIAGVYLVRSLSTAPTAALAGLFLFATLTLIPSLAPASAMAKARANAMKNSSRQPSGSDLSMLENIPHIFPRQGFSEFMSGRVSGPVMQDSISRAAAAIPLLLLAAIMFRRRELAK
ncbi:MAG: hypothetical protein L3J82_06305 [Planctomycetes bacterium]|nr:hypothetical protein [Planctomycetota bacterium]